MSLESLLEKIRQLVPNLPAGATNEQLADFETSLGSRLPGALRSLYLDHNGETPGPLFYRFLPLHDVYRRSDGVWCFWESRLIPEDDGADYHFADGSVHCEGQSFAGIEEFLLYLLDQPRLLLPEKLPRLPDAFEAAERLDEKPRREAVQDALNQAAPELAPALLQYLNDDDQMIVIATCEWMSRNQVSSSVRSLAYTVRDARNPETRAVALRCLESLGGQLLEYEVKLPVPDEFSQILATTNPGDLYTLLKRGPGAAWEWILCRPVGPVAREFPDSVRQRPGLYFGRTDGQGALQVALELVANAVDQTLLGHATQVRVRHHEWSLIVEDDGSGYPLESERGERHLTQFHDSPTGDDHAPHIHLVTRGVGLAPVNAASSTYQVEAVRDGQGYRLKFERGELISREKAELDFPKGTRVTLTLDPEIWQEGFQPGPIRRRLFDFVHLIPGLTIELNHERFHAPRGLLDLACFDTGWQGDRSLSYHGQTDFLTLHMAAIGESDRRMHIESWVNGARTEEHGSHVDGALEALQEAGWRPARLLVHVILREPKYAGPVRRRLMVPKALRQVRELLRPVVS